MFLQFVVCSFLRNSRCRGSSGAHSDHGPAEGCPAPAAAAAHASSAAGSPGEIERQGWVRIIVISRLTWLHRDKREREEGETKEESRVGAPRTTENRSTFAPWLRSREKIEESSGGGTVAREDKRKTRVWVESERPLWLSLSLSLTQKLTPNPPGRWLFIEMW